MTTAADNLWTHQEQGLTKARQHFGHGARCVLIQLPTGTGKTKMVVSGINGAITKPAPGQKHLPSSQRRLQSVAFVVPRRELLWQSKAELKKWGIINKVVKKLDDPKSFNVHIWCRDTFIRRVRSGDLQQWPDLIIVDEAHLGLKQWLEILEAAPAHTKFLGVTATPERLDRGDLSKMWDVLIEGDQLVYFVENGFLKRPYLLGPSPESRITHGIKFKYGAKSGDLTRESNKILNDLYKQRAGSSKVIYGKEIDHYLKHAPGEQALVFVRSLDQAEEVAENFRAKGIPALRIDGKMNDTKRKKIVDSFKSTETRILTTVDLLCYGFDAPGASCGIDMAPTDSIAKQFQKLGRILRWDAEHPIGKWLDMVGNFDTKNHGHPLEPRKWNWTGAERKAKPPDGALELVSAVDKCPVCWDLMINGICRSCGAKKIIKHRKDLKEVDGYLVEILPGEQLPMTDRLPENQRAMQDRINSAVSRYKNDWYSSDDHGGGVINEQALRDLLEVAVELKWKNPPVAVYKKLVPHADMMVNTPLLAMICKIKEYSNIWIERQREFFELGLLSRQRAQERVDAEPPGWAN